MLLRAALARLLFMLSHWSLLCGSAKPVPAVGHRLCIHKPALLQVMTALLPVGLGQSVTRPHESRKEECRSHGQERAHSGNAHQRTDGEVEARNEMRAKAISNQEIEDDHIEQTREQAWRVGVASNGPIHVDSKHVGDESRQKDEWQDDPMATKTVKEQVADRNRSNGSRVKPEEHPHGIGRPEVVSYPLHKPAVQECLVKDMHNV